MKAVIFVPPTPNEWYSKITSYSILHEIIDDTTSLYRRHSTIFHMGVIFRCNSLIKYDSFSWLNPTHSSNQPLLYNVAHHSVKSPIVINQENWVPSFSCVIYWFIKTSISIIPPVLGLYILTIYEEGSYVKASYESELPWSINYL